MYHRYCAYCRACAGHNEHRSPDTRKTLASDVKHIPFFFKLEQRNLDCPVLVIIKQGLTFKIKNIFLTAGACAPERKGKTARDPNCGDQ